MDLFKISRESKFSNKVKECLSNSELAEGSIRQYWRAFRLWVECFSHKKSRVPSEMDFKLFARFLYDRYEYSSNKFHLTMYSMLSIFKRYAAYYGMSFDDRNMRDLIVVLIESYKKSNRGNISKTVEPISDGACRALLEYVRDIGDVRMELLLRLVGETGFRRIDLTNLSVNNLTFKDKKVIVKTIIQKTKQPIEVNLNDIYTIELLKKWIKDNDLINNDLIFHSIRLGVRYKASPWTRQALYHQLNTYLKKCNITEHITLVSFRKKLAQSLYNMDTNFQKIKEQLGWSSDAAKSYITDGFWNKYAEIDNVVSFDSLDTDNVPFYMKETIG